MATTFDEVLLDVLYSADAEGGPEFATAIIRSGDGGAVASRNSNREDFVSRYSIDFLEVSPVRRKALRTFAILREGMSRGFRFLAPDDHEMIGEYVGWLNPATGEIAAKLVTDGTTVTYYLINYLTDQANSYTRRITKPSPFDSLSVKIFQPNNLTAPISIAVFPANAAVGAFNVINETAAVNFTGYFSTLVTMNFHQGKFTTASALPAGFTIQIDGIYHIPVAFSQDWQKFSIDEVGLSEFKLGLEELLPVELGIV